MQKERARVGQTCSNGQSIRVQCGARRKLIKVVRAQGDL